MDCPNCESEPLVRRVIVGKAQVDRCEACRGFWLDRGELPRMTSDPFAARDGVEAAKRDSAEGDRDCPRCRTRMRCGVFGGTDVELDWCPACLGIWCDAGEMRTIARYVDAEARAGLPPVVGRGRDQRRRDRAKPKVKPRGYPWAFPVVLVGAGLAVAGLLAGWFRWLANAPTLSFLVVALQGVATLGFVGLGAVVLKEKWCWRCNDFVRGWERIWVGDQDDDEGSWKEVCSSCGARCLHGWCWWLAAGFALAAVWIGWF